METTFFKVLILIQCLVVALDSLLNYWEDLELDAAQLVVWSICNQLLLLGILLCQCLLCIVLNPDWIAILVNGSFLLILEQFSFHDAGLSFVCKTFGVKELRISGLDLDRGIEVCSRLIELFKAEENVAPVVEDVRVRVSAEALAVLLLDIHLPHVVILVALVRVLARVRIVSFDSDRGIEILQGLIVEAHVVISQAPVVVVHSYFRVADLDRLLEVFLCVRK